MVARRLKIGCYLSVTRNYASQMMKFKKFRERLIIEAFIPVEEVSILSFNLVCCEGIMMSRNYRESQTGEGTERGITAGRVHKFM